MEYTVKFHGGPADGQELTADTDDRPPLERVLVDMTEIRHGEICWSVFLYRRATSKSGTVHYWLGDIQVAIAGPQELGKN